ncbi:MAG: hypothetical protein LBQ81_02640 [Zoogloeaceae bacterium]|nr:hypothetical protein [Zoogloeaceae bacterium]
MRTTTALTGMGASSSGNAERSRQQALDAANPVDLLSSCPDSGTGSNAGDCTCDAVSSNVCEAASDSTAESVGDIILGAAESAGEFALNAASEVFGSLLGGL